MHFQATGTPGIPTLLTRLTNKIYGKNALNEEALLEESIVNMRALILLIITSVMLSGSLAQIQSHSSREGLRPFGSAQPGAWITMLTIDPHNNKVIYAATRDSGVFMSNNMGENWVLCDSGITEKHITSLAVDPFVPGILYAGSRKGVFKSVDAGESWKTSGLGTVSTFNFVVQASKPPRIYALTGHGLFRTDSDGANWKKLKPLHENTWIAPLAADPANPTTIYSHVGRSKDVIVADGWDGEGLYTSNDFGESWRKISSIPAKILAIAPRDSDTMYAGTPKGIMKSIDKGRTWNFIGVGDTKSELNSLVIHPRISTVLYATTSYNELPLNWSLSRVYRSNNSGGSWKEVSNFPANCVIVDPINPSIIYAGTPGGGVYKSTDAGESWHASNSGLLQ
jgi:photosystem II stability/assembly factor-like uncharacterized protein